LSEREATHQLILGKKPEMIVHLAAQAGVRYSLENPHTYVDSNLTAFVNILEAARALKIRHLVYASSSSVYGANNRVPFSVEDRADHPLSLYAATKRANELMAYSYSHLFELPVTGLRFFTVYGPWGRPDMSYFLFTKAIREGKEIKVFNHGDMRRDFTYVDDIIEGVVRIMKIPPTGEKPPYQLFNIGNNHPIPLMEFIGHLEDLLGQKAVMKFLPLQPGDMLETCANIDSLAEKTGYTPQTKIRDGLKHFVDWYLEWEKK
jgi:UDP-glucuronate 4-epimerase